jgi:hypothetical protein
VRQGLRSQFHALLHRCRQRKSLRVVALGQRLRHFAKRIDATMGEAHGERVRYWFGAKKAGWYAVLADPKMPAMSTVLDQAHNAIDRKLFAMKGLHHPGGSQAAFLTGLAHLYNLIPYQCRALNAGKCGVEVEGGRVPTSDWILNLQILTSGGYRYTPEPPHHLIRWNLKQLNRIATNSGKPEAPEIYFLRIKLTWLAQCLRFDFFHIETQAHFMI